MGLLALFALGKWCIILLLLVSGSLFLGVWVLHVDYGTLDSSGDDFVRGCNAWLDSGYGACDSTWLLEELSIFSTSTWARILALFLLLIGEVCSVDASI